jgi:hypothetical protein
LFCDATRDRKSNKVPIFINSSSFAFTGFAIGVKLGSFFADRALTLGVKLGTAGALTLGVKLGTAGEDNCAPIGIIGPAY